MVTDPEGLPDEWSYYELAREFGWTPAQVDAMPYVTIARILDLSRLDREVAADRQRAASAKAAMHGGRHG